MKRKSRKWSKKTRELFKKRIRRRIALKKLAKNTPFGTIPGESLARGESLMETASKVAAKMTKAQQKWFSNGYSTALQQIHSEKEKLEVELQRHRNRSSERQRQRQFLAPLIQTIEKLLED